MNLLGIIALIATGILGFVGTKIWAKIDDIKGVIELIFNALEDKILDKEEIKEIWDAIKEL